MGGKRIPIPEEDLELFKFERAKRGDPKWVEWKLGRYSFTIRETRWRASKWRIPIYIFLFGVFFFWLPFSFAPVAQMWGHLPLLRANGLFSIEELIVNVSVFPHGWRAHSMGPRNIHFAATAISGAQLFYYSDLGYAQQSLRFFTDRDDLETEFDRQLDIWFPEGQFAPDWYTPPELQDASLEAESFMVGCTLTDQEYCHLVSLLDPYVIHFSAPIGNRMTYADFIDVARAIETRISRYGASKTW